MKNIFTPAMAELRAALNEAEQISAKPELTKRDEARVNVLLAKIAALRQNAVAPDNAKERYFRTLFGGGVPGEFVETRDDILAGGQTINYDQGALGGYLVPQEYHDEVFFALSENDPFLDPNIVTVLQSKNYSLRPLTVPAWDLSQYQAHILGGGSPGDYGEGFQWNDSVPPSGKVNLKGWTFGAALDDTFEWEGDAFQPAITFMTKAYTEAFTKGIGINLVNGDGISGPEGLLTAATDSGYITANAGKFVADDFDAIYFKLNKRYRNSTKCAWVMADETYQLARKAKDDAGRPLIDIRDNGEFIMGKRVVVSPSWKSGAGSKAIGFGDLSYYVVRASRMIIVRNTQAPGFVEYGKVLYAARMRADARLVNPANGSFPTFIYATQHA
mgnify:CR=1 FL=1